MTLERASGFLRSKLNKIEVREATVLDFSVTITLIDGKKILTRDDRTYAQAVLEARDVPRLVQELLDEGAVDEFQPIVVALMKESRLLKYLKERDGHAQARQEAEARARALGSRPRSAR